MKLPCKSYVSAQRHAGVEERAAPLHPLVFLLGLSAGPTDTLRKMTSPFQWTRMDLIKANVINTK